MKKISKGKIIALAAILLLGFIGYQIWNQWQKAQFQENYGQYSYYAPEYRPNYAFFDGKKALFYNWEMVESEEEQQMAKVEGADHNFYSIRAYDYGYFVNSYMKLKNDPRQGLYDFNRNVPEKGEYWKLAVYKLDGEKLKRKEFDVFKMVRSFDDNLVPSEVDSIGMRKSATDEKRYIRIILHPKHSEKDEDYKVYFIDLDEGKILTPNEVELDKKSSTQNNFVSDTSLHDNLAKEGVRLATENAGLYDTYPQKKLKKTVLAKDYPELCKIIQGYGGQVTYLTETTDIELVQKIAELFFPPGTNVFENVTIPADHSVDGQEHVVNSAEELQQYYKEGE